MGKGSLALSRIMITTDTIISSCEGDLAYAPEPSVGSQIAEVRPRLLGCYAFPEPYDLEMRYGSKRRLERRVGQGVPSSGPSPSYSARTGQGPFNLFKTSPGPCWHRSGVVVLDRLPSVWHFPPQYHSDAEQFRRFDRNCEAS